jgi:hypothetical protein
VKGLIVDSRCTQFNVQRHVPTHRQGVNCLAIVRITPRALALLSLLVLTGGCGSSSGVSPDLPPAAVGRPWSGIVNVTDRGVTSSFGVEQRVSVSITQSAASLTGEFTSFDMSGAFVAALSGTDLSGT